MLAHQIGSTLREARQFLAISQAELATRAGVTTRLVSEFERGVRPNVSLETALRILNEVGVVIQLGAPNGQSMILLIQYARTLVERPEPRRDECMESGVRFACRTRG